MEENERKQAPEAGGKEKPSTAQRYDGEVADRALEIMRKQQEIVKRQMQIVKGNKEQADVKKEK